MEAPAFDVKTETLDLPKQLAHRLARFPERASRHELYLALAYAVRERLIPRWMETRRRVREEKARQVGYLSLEFHLGRLLRSALQALDLEQAAQESLPLGVRLADLEEEEPNANLGSGGLGRLAACFLDSLATLDLPGWGYGLRYELGLAKQLIRNGHQHEEPDPWLEDGRTPWEIPRLEDAVTVSFGGHVEVARDVEGRVHYTWVGADQVLAVPHDLPVPGYRTRTVNTLRLWSAQPPSTDLDLHAFAQGHYPRAWRAETLARSINAFLYPTDTTTAGKELRLRQQFLLSSASVQDVLRRHLASGETLDTLPEQFVLQLNDTHPAIAIPELMRLLMDEHCATWERSWGIARRVFAYTNHTLLPEALETWPVELLGRLLPRHLQIIQEIDRRFQDDIRRAFPGDGSRITRMAVLGRGRVRMANLAVVGSYSVNGVAALHTELLKTGLMHDLYVVFPERFNNKTNGITQRRWLKQANPGLAELISERIGDGWERDLSQLRKLEPLAEDAEFQTAFQEVKLANKRALAQVIERDTGVPVDPHSLFDVLIKRIHEYKRQLLLVLWAVDRYQQLLAQPDLDAPPRVVMFAGKAAPSYHVAKQVVRLIHAVGTKVNDDPAVRGRLKVVFLPNYRVSLAQEIVPAADLSEQISTAGYEASGTGNMKLTLNGALTLGTLDGANVEIREEVGKENIFIFGLEAHEVREAREQGYRPRERYEQDARLRRILDAIAGGTFGPGFEDLVHQLLDWDHYMLLADFPGYVEAQERVEALYRDPAAWTRKAILNTARVGKFSSDRTISDYARHIWRIDPLPPRRS